MVDALIFTRDDWTVKNFYSKLPALKSDELSSNKLSLILFWAGWHPLCVSLEESFSEIVESFEGEVFFTSINVDNELSSVDEYQIKEVPTVIFYKNNEIINSLKGAFSIEVLRDIIERNL